MPSRFFEGKGEIMLKRQARQALKVVKAVFAFRVGVVEGYD